jgi:hypothetical protein
MRVLMKTTPVPTSIRDPRDNSPHVGKLHLEVLHLDPADVPAGLPARTLEQVRAEFQGRGPIISYPPPHWNGTPTQIPESILAQLAPTDLVEFRWVFNLGAKR